MSLCSFIISGPTVFQTSSFAQLWLCRICQRSTGLGFTCYFLAKLLKSKPKPQVLIAVSLIWRVACLIWHGVKGNGQFRLLYQASTFFLQIPSSRCLHHWAVATAERHHHQDRLFVVFVVSASPNGALVYAVLPLEQSVVLTPNNYSGYSSNQYYGTLTKITNIMVSLLT